MTSLVENLRALARHEHSDLSIASEAADEITRLTAPENALDLARDAAASYWSDNGTLAAAIRAGKCDDTIEVKVALNALRHPAQPLKHSQ